MDFSKLSSDEKLLVYSAVALVIAGIISNWGGLVWLSVLAGVAVVVVVLLPQLSPTTTLPGSKGTILVILGGIAAIGAVIELLRFLEYFFRTLDDWQTWMFVIALAAALFLAWTAWKMFQAEGGKFVIGTSPGTGASTPASDAPASDAPAGDAHASDAAAGGGAASDTAPAEPASTAAPAAPAEPAATSAPAESMTTPAAEHAEEADEDEDENRRV